MEALLLLILATYHQPNVVLAYDGPPAEVAYTPVDNGFGSGCPSFINREVNGKILRDGEHYHTAEGVCRYDSDDAVAGR